MVIEGDDTMAASNLRNVVRPRILLAAGVALGTAANVCLRRQLFETPEGIAHQVVLATSLGIIILTSAAAAALAFQIIRPHGSSALRTIVGLIVAMIVGAF